MTRRPPMPPDGNIRRAHQRMAPGGRLWSESPVRGPAVRVVAAGDDPPADPVSIDEDDAFGFTGQTDTDVVLLSGMVVGDLIVSWGAYAGYAPDTSGWTVVASGTVGTALSYAVMWKLADATLVDDGGFSLPLSGPGSAYQMNAAAFRDPGALRPAVVGAVGTALAASAIPYVAAGGTLPWQYAVLLPTTPAPVTMADDPPLSLDTAWTGTLLSGGNAVLAHRGTLPWRAWFGDPGTYPATTDATSTIAGDWFSMALALGG